MRADGRTGASVILQTSCVLMEIKPMHAELCYRIEISNRCVRSAGYLEEANVLIGGV